MLTYNLGGESEVRPIVLMPMKMISNWNHEALRTVWSVSCSICFPLLQISCPSVLIEYRINYLLLLLSTSLFSISYNQVFHSYFFPMAFTLYIRIRIRFLCLVDSVMPMVRVCW